MSQPPPSENILGVLLPNLEGVAGTDGGPGAGNEASGATAGKQKRERRHSQVNGGRPRKPGENGVPHQANGVVVGGENFVKNTKNRKSKKWKKANNNNKEDGIGKKEGGDCDENEAPAAAAELPDIVANEEAAKPGAKPKPAAKKKEFKPKPGSKRPSEDGRQNSEEGDKKVESKAKPGKGERMAKKNKRKAGKPEATEAAKAAKPEEKTVTPENKDAKPEEKAVQPEGKAVKDQSEKKEAAKTKPDLPKPVKPSRQRKRHLTGKRDADAESGPAICGKCKSPTPPTAAAAAQKIDGAEGAAAAAVPSPRPRDSPSRYDFRKLKPAPPLISELADSEGLLMPPPSAALVATTADDLPPPPAGKQTGQQPATALPPALQPRHYNELTMAEFALSPKKVVGLKAQQEVSNSPVTGGNLAGSAKDLKVVTGDLSPPSSSSTMSSTNIQHLLSDFADSGSKTSKFPSAAAAVATTTSSASSSTSGLGSGTSSSAGTAAAAAPTSAMTYTHSDPEFEPVDVTKNSGYVFCASQANNRVEVFSHEGKSAGKLRVNDKKLFDLPRNVLHIGPQCKAMQTESSSSLLLNAGCVVVLDNNGFHFFSENGQHLGTILEGQGSKFRGLASYRRKTVTAETEAEAAAADQQKGERLYLVSIEVGGSKGGGVNLVFIDLREALKSSTNLSIDRIGISESEDGVLKCRFVSTMCDDVTGNTAAAADHFAFVSAMKAGKIFKVDLINKTSSVLALQRDAAAKADDADVDDDDDTCKDATFRGGGGAVQSPPKQRPESTFVDSRPPKMVPFVLKEPTGLAVDKFGNLLIADRATDRVHLFNSRDGSHIQCVNGDKAGAPLQQQQASAPIGIHYDSKEHQVYVASNKTKAVISFQL